MSSYAIFERQPYQWYRVLVGLCAGLRAGQIARGLRVTPQVVSHHLETLETLGYVVRSGLGHVARAKPTLVGIQAALICPCCGAEGKTLNERQEMRKVSR